MNTDESIAGVFACLLVMLAILLSVSFAVPAGAQESWPWSEFSKPAPKKVKRKPQVRAYVRRKRVRKAKPKTVDGFQCAREFSVTGRVKATKERAMKSAWAEFHGAVKFALGERYADDRFAKKPRFECARSTSETLTSKTIEAVGGGGVYRHRCHLRAIACKPPVSQ
jgi:hypothetical protein